MSIFLKISLSMFLEIPDECEEASELPIWIDRSEYPFQSHFYHGWNGEKVHYVDEGSGTPLVFLHGNPTWSFMYRTFIKHLSPHYRCIAPDYPGFGLSKLKNNISYEPDSIAKNVVELIQRLKLRDVTLVLHDWGGPIGMWYAVNHPGNVASIIVMNSWMWPLNGQLIFEIFSRFMGGQPGRYLINRYNLFSRFIMKFGFGNPDNFTTNIRQHYIRPFNQSYSRQQQWTLASCLLKSSKWLQEIWDKRKVIEHIPTMLFWGMRDPMFTKTVLSKWKNIFVTSEVVYLKQAGHYVPEEISEADLHLVENFLFSHTHKDSI